MRGKPFVPGDQRAGRPAGALNRTSRDARELAQKLLSDPAYVDSLKERLLAGKLGDLEKVLWQYAYGPPPAHPIDKMTLMFETLPGVGDGRV